MRFLTFVGLLSVLITSHAETTRYKVQHRRPSEILASLTGSNNRTERTTEAVGGPSSLLPEGVTAKADDPSGTLIFDGPKKTLKEIDGLVAMFDVAPRKVSALLTVSCPMDSYASKTDSELTSGSLWTMQDERAGVTVSIRPRVNQDGSVTAAIHLLYGKRQEDVVIRLHPKHSLRIGFSEDGTFSFDQTSKDSHAGGNDDAAPPRLMNSGSKSSELEVTVTLNPS